MSKRRERSGRTRPAETSLYGPVKAFLERQSYEVKGEIGGCDLIARRGDEPPLIVELKTALTMELLLQGIDRLSVSDGVYIAVPAPRGMSVLHDRRFQRLLRRVGLGLMTVDLDRNGSGAVEVILDPLPYRPRTDRRRVGRLLGEFARRVGDPSAGGSARVKIVTSYRQECLRIASVLAAHGPQSPAALKAAAEAPSAARILRRDVYGWFERPARAIYRLTPAGLEALSTFAGRFAPPASVLPGSAVARAA